MTPSTRAPMSWRPLAMAALLAMAPLVHAQGTISGRTVVMPKDSAADRVLRTTYQGNFSFVRIERAEPQAAPNQHPVVIKPADLTAALAALRKAGSKDEEVFNGEELTEIVPHLVKALAEVQPDQDISFAVVGRHAGFGPLVPRVVTTARMFRTAEGLQIIIGLLHQTFESQFIATGYLIPFESGRRAAVVDPTARIGTGDGGGTVRRADWVALAPPAPATAAAAPAAGTAAPAAAAIVAPAAAATPPSRPRDAKFFEEQEERLKTLKRLRDKDLITEAEYQQKRAEVLQAL